MAWKLYKMQPISLEIHEISTWWRNEAKLMQFLVVHEQ